MYQPDDPSEQERPELAQPEAVRPGVPVEVRRLLIHLRRHKRIPLIGLGVGALLGLVAALLWAPREFTSQALLSWDATLARAEGNDAQRELHTLMDSVKVPAVLSEVRRRLGLAATLDGLATQLSVEWSPFSNLVSITAAASTAQSAFDLERTTLEVFLQQRLILEKKRLEEAVRALAAAQAAAVREVADLRASYEEFRKAEQVSDLDAELQQALGESARLNLEQVTSRADASGQAARIQALSLEMQGRALEVVLSERKVRPVGSKLADVESELAGLRGGGLADDHPRVTMLEAQASALRAQNDSWATSVVTERNSGRNPDREALRTLIAEANASREASLGREKALVSLAAEAARRVERLKVIESKGAELARSLRAAQGHLAELSGKHLLALDAAREPNSGLSVLDAPQVATRPRRSLRKNVAAAGTALGGVIGVLVALALGLRGLRIHTAAEVAFWGNGPVVFSTEWPLRGDGADVQFDFVNEARAAPGITLIVGAGEVERGMVQQLAELGKLLAFEGPAGAEDARLTVWMGEGSGPALRRAARRADRVLVVVASGQHSALALVDQQGRIGAESRLAFVLLALPADLALLPDRAGDTRSFWFAEGERPKLRVAG